MKKPLFGLNDFLKFKLMFDVQFIFIESCRFVVNCTPFLINACYSMS